MFKYSLLQGAVTSNKATLFLGFLQILGAGASRGYFYAYSLPKNDEDDYSGGWAISSNRPEKVSEYPGAGHFLAMTIDPSKIDTFATQYLGYKLFISNTSADTISFKVKDSWLNLKLQAQDKHGKWRGIEYLPTSWCANSNHIIELLPNYFWSFTIPKYHGDFQTNIRARLQFIDKLNPKKEVVTYSNTITGGINPG